MEFFPFTNLKINNLLREQILVESLSAQRFNLIFIEIVRKIFKPIFNLMVNLKKNMSVYKEG